MGDRQHTRGDLSPRDRREVRARGKRSRPNTSPGATRDSEGFDWDFDRPSTGGAASAERPERPRARRERRSRTVAVVVLVVVALVIAIIGATAGASVLGEDAGDTPPFSLLPITPPSSTSATVGSSVAWKTTPSARTAASNGAGALDSTAASNRGAEDVRFSVPAGAESETGPIAVVDVRAEGSAETSQ